MADVTPTPAPPITPLTPESAIAAYPMFINALGLYGGYGPVQAYPQSLVSAVFNKTDTADPTAALATYKPYWDWYVTPELADLRRTETDASLVLWHTRSVTNASLLSIKAGTDRIPQLDPTAVDGINLYSATYEEEVREKTQYLADRANLPPLPPPAAGAPINTPNPFQSIYPYPFAGPAIPQPGGPAPAAQPVAPTGGGATP